MTWRLMKSLMIISNVLIGFHADGNQEVETRKELYAALEGSLALYDCENMVVFVKMQEMWIL